MKIKLKLLSLVLFLFGIFFIVNSKLSITGAVVGVHLSLTLNNILGLSLILFSLILLINLSKLEKKIKIRKFYYGPHAIKRMEERHLMPTVVEDIIEHGRHYKLKHVRDPRKAIGGTDAYIKKHASIMAGKGRIGERIIKLELPEKRKRNSKNLIVLTGYDKSIKDVLIQTDNELNKWRKKYIKNKK